MKHRKSQKKELNNTELPFITLILPTLNEAAFIDKCLRSVFANDYPQDKLELLIFDGGSTDATVPIIHNWQVTMPFLQLFSNPKRIVSHALNLGISKANGDFVIRIDAHSAYPKNYFSTLVSFAINSKAANTGGVWLTLPQNESAVGLAICTVLSHPLGVGNAKFRIGAKNNQFVDTVPFGCFPKKVFEQYGNFNEQLVRNQDYEFNNRIRKYGGKILLVPEVVATYFARSDYFSFAKNNFANGLWVIKTIQITRSVTTMSWRHLVPILPILGIITVATTPFISKQLFWVATILMAIYFFTLGIVSLIEMVRKGINPLLTLIAFLLLHLAYGAGILIGLVSVLVNKKGNY